MSDTTTTKRVPAVRLADVALDSRVTTITGNLVGNKSIRINYKGLPGNRPQTYANHLAVWQASHAIPWNQTPLQDKPVKGDTEDGTMSFALPLQAKPYIVGYAAGTELHTICSTLTLYPDGKTETFYSQVEPADFATDFVTVQYSVPLNSKPKDWKYFVALWEGTVAPFEGTPLAKSDVPDNSTTSQASIDYALLTGQVYTVALYTGAKLTEMAATCTFTAP